MQSHGDKVKLASESLLGLLELALACSPRFAGEPIGSRVHQGPRLRSTRIAQSSLAWGACVIMAFPISPCPEEFVDGMKHLMS